MARIKTKAPRPAAAKAKKSPPRSRTAPAPSKAAAKKPAPAKVVRKPAPQARPSAGKSAPDRRAGARAASSAEPLLQIRGLEASIDGKKILNGVDLVVRPGEVHAIMGPNGSGKSTLANVLAGREAYTVGAGSATYQGTDLLSLEPEVRAREGVFLAFQYPVELPGVSNVYFLKAALNAIRKHRGLPELDAMEFLGLVRAKSRELGMDESFLNRSVNEGFSGGEKKRNEILQMALLEPRLALLDETDSGLDIDALKTVAEGVNRLRSRDRAIVVVTHYQRLLDYIVPDFVHVLAGGRLVRSGGPELAHQLEAKGYGWLEGAARAGRAPGRATP